MTSHLHIRPMQKLSPSYDSNLREKKVPVRQDPRLRLYTVIPVLLGSLAGAGLLVSQQPPSKQDSAASTSFVLRQTVRRVRLDVVVTDGQGRPVKGLNASDFQVAEDGKPQSIRQFESRGADVTPVALPKRPPLPLRTFMNLPAAPERGPLTVLLYDVLNTPLDAQTTARAQMLEFLKKNSGRRIAIFVLGDRLRILQGFTQDTDSLEHAAANAGTMPQSSTNLFSNTSQIDGMNKLAADAASDVSNPGASGMAAAIQKTADREASAEARYASYLIDRRVDITLDALAQIGHFLSSVPGRKSLLWFSGSFPASILPDPEKSIIQPNATTSPTAQSDDSKRNYLDRMRKATNSLNTAEVAIYPIDARGLQTNAYFNASANKLTGSGPSALKAGQSSFNHSASEFAAMDDLSEQTGGRAFYNTNGLKEALEKAADDGTNYYSLVYAPTNPKFDGTLRKVSVHLEHGHYHLAYRRTYFADDLDSPVHSDATADKEPVPTDTMALAWEFGAPPAHDLIFAVHMEPVGKPEKATAEEMATLAPYQKQAAKVEDRKLVEPVTPVMMQKYEIVYAAAATQLDTPQSADNRYQSDVSFAALAFDEDGETLWGTKSQMKDSIPASKFVNIQRDGFQAVQAVSLPVNTAVIRLVVRDEHSGRIGSMEIRLPLPPDQQQPAQNN